VPVSFRLVIGELPPPLAKMTTEGPVLVSKEGPWADTTAGSRMASRPTAVERVTIAISFLLGFGSANLLTYWVADRYIPTGRYVTGHILPRPCAAQSGSAVHHWARAGI